MKASVIIRCKDEERRIGAVLDGVFSQEGLAPPEVVVVDSGSTDGTLDIVSRYRCKLIRIRPEEFGYGYTMNLGAKNSDGEVLVYLSAHCPPAGRGWLKALTEPFSDPKVAGTFGRQLPVKGENPFEEWRLSRAFPKSPLKLQPHMFSSANAAVRRGAWEVVPFDEDLPFSEDRQWAREGQTRGWRTVYVPEAAVYHSHRFSLSGVRARAYAAGWAKKKIYGDACRFDSHVWAAAAYAYCVLADVFHFTLGGYWRCMPHIPRYRLLEVSGFYLGARDFKKGAKGADMS